MNHNISHLETLKYRLGIMVIFTSRSWYIISNIFLPLDVKTFSAVLDNNDLFTKDENQ